eukprot:169793-Rhodomonas_salina.1
MCIRDRYCDSLCSYAVPGLLSGARSCLRSLAVCCTELGYGATRCVLLSEGTTLRTCYGSLCTELRYHGTRGSR